MSVTLSKTSSWFEKKSFVVINNKNLSWVAAAAVLTLAAVPKQVSVATQWLVFAGSSTSYFLLTQLLMFLLFERQKNFFEFSMPNQDGTKWALLAVAAVPDLKLRYGYFYSLSVWVNSISWFKINLWKTARKGWHFMISRRLVSLSPSRIKASRLLSSKNKDDTCMDHIFEFFRVV